MSDKFTYDFEELPLVVDGRIKAGLVNGTAEITFWRDGSWAVTGATLEGFERIDYSDEDFTAAVKEGRKLPAYRWHQVAVESGQIFSSIVARLESDFSDHIQDRVDSLVGTSGRTDFEEHNTLNKAQQGIK